MSKLKISRLPVIRHIRYYFKRVRLSLYLAKAASLGLGFWESEADAEHLKKVWRGEL